MSISLPGEMPFPTRMDGGRSILYLDLLLVLVEDHRLPLHFHDLVADSDRYALFVLRDSEKLVACVNGVVLRKLYSDPTADDKLFCEFIAQAFLNSLLDVLRKGLTREQTTEMVHRLLVFYFEKIEDRI